MHLNLTFPRPYCAKKGCPFLSGNPNTLWQDTVVIKPLDRKNHSEKYSLIKKKYEISIKNQSIDIAVCFLFLTGLFFGYKLSTPIKLNATHF